MEFVQGYDGMDAAENQEYPAKAPEKKRPSFIEWEVGGKAYKLRLSTATICQLEERFKANLLTVISTGGGLPPLATMLTLVHAGMKQWEHSVKYADVQNMFDQYCMEGGTQLSLLTDVIMPLYQVSGFFSESQAEDMNRKMEDVREMM